MRRLGLVICVLLLALPGAALGQQGGGAFGPLPPAAPALTATPAPSPAAETQTQNDRTLLFVIGGGLLVLFAVIVRAITRDAKHTVRAHGGDVAPQQRDPHRHAKQAKAKARAKSKAQRRARRANR